VTLSSDVNGRRFATVPLQPLANQIQRRLRIALYAPVFGGIGTGSHATETRTDRIDEHEIGGIEEGLGVVEQSFALAIEAERTEGRERQGARRCPGAAIEGEQHWSRRAIANAVAYV